MMLHFFNDIVDDVSDIVTKVNNYVLIASLKSVSTCKLINRIHVPGSRLLISSLPGKASRTLVESQGWSTSVLEALPGKHDIKIHGPSILYFQVMLNG